MSDEYRQIRRTRPGIPEVQASIVEGDFERRDFDLDFGTGRRGHSVRSREQGADFVILETIQTFEVLLGLHSAVGVERRAVYPRFVDVHRVIRKSQSCNEKTRTLAFERRVG